MRIVSIVCGFSFGFCFFILGPLLTIALNDYYHLPIYSSIVLKIIGVLLILIGSGIFLYCSHIFSVFGFGTPVPIEPPKQLMQEGIFSYSRNPIYIGYILILLGEFFLFGHSLLLIYSILSFLVLHFYIIYFEERGLENRFGIVYRQYKKNVPRWF